MFQHGNKKNCFKILTIFFISYFCWLIIYSFFLLIYMLITFDLILDIWLIHCCLCILLFSCRALHFILDRNPFSFVSVFSSLACLNFFFFLGQLKSSFYCRAFLFIYFVYIFFNLFFYLYIYLFIFVYFNLFFLLKNGLSGISTEYIKCSATLGWWELLIFPVNIGMNFSFLNVNFLKLVVSPSFHLPCFVNFYPNSIFLSVQY